MTYHDEQRRQLNEPPLDRAPPLRSGIEWGLPLGIAGAALVLGLVFYNVNRPTATATTAAAPAQHARAECREGRAPGEAAIAS